MMSVLENKSFDVQKFVNHPKCVGAWEAGKAGCLLTAFVRAFGVFTRDESILGQGKEIRDEVELLAIKYIPDVVSSLPRQHVYVTKFNQPVVCDLKRNFFSQYVVYLYDTGREVEALNLLWQLIDALPNKVGFAKIEDVVMPEVCNV